MQKRIIQLFETFITKVKMILCTFKINFSIYYVSKTYI